MFRSEDGTLRCPVEARWVGPVFAYEAIRLALAAKREMESASASQHAASRITVAHYS